MGTQIWSNNPAERLNREIRRSIDAVSIFPDHAAIVMLVRGLIAKQTDKWAEGCRNPALEGLARCRLNTGSEVNTGTEHPLGLSA